MVQINFAHREIQCKVVYYGPGMSGKTTNLELVHEKTPGEARGELTSIATTGERTLYFDYMPLDLGSIAGIRTKFQLYTVPGQIYYKSTRRLVLQGVDGIVFVADSSAGKVEENRESMRDLEENLREMGRSLGDVPLVVQYNKRDLPDALPVDDLQRLVNPQGLPWFEAVATTGQGVFPTLKALAGMVLEAVNKGGISASRSTRSGQAAAAGSATAVPAAVGAAVAAAPAAARTTGAGMPVPPPQAAPRAFSPGSTPAPRLAPPPRAHTPATAPAPVQPPEAPEAPASPAPWQVGAVARPAAPSAPPPSPAPPPVRPLATLPTTAPAAPAPAAPPPAWRTTPAAASPARPMAPAPYRPSPGSATVMPGRPVDQRIVKVSGLGRTGRGGRAFALLGLLGLVAAAAWYVLTRLV